MTKTAYAKGRGKTIEVDDDPGVVDGQKIEVRVTVIKTKKKLQGPRRGWRPGARGQAAA